MLDLIVATVPALPLGAALWIGVSIVLGRACGAQDEPRTRRIALAATAGAFLATLLLIAARARGWLPAAVTLGEWLESGDYRVGLDFITDGLSLTMMALVSGLCLVVTRFSINYMHQEEGFHRFFLLLSLFTAAMLVLVMSGNAVLGFVGWELAGLCSYLLISYFYDRTTAAANATQAFVTNRVGDAGFLLGIALSFYWLGGVGWSTLATETRGLSPLQTGVLAGSFLLAAMAKSAQVPLAPWLARAVEGPTPSSALFYGAVMVHAGVYLILRLQPLFEQSPLAMAALALVGLTTALYGFLCGLVQTDIKSALVFSTSGQVGLMFFACGLGLWRLAWAHLCCHAIFRAYQFLTAPSILHQLHGAHTRPVPAFLARQRWAYTAALQRFWLEDLGDWLLVRPVRRLASALNTVDYAVLNRAAGLPLPAVHALSSLAAWEECKLGAGRFLEDAPRDIGRGRGIPARVAQWMATACHWFEDQVVFKAIGQGIVRAGRSLAMRLGQIEQLLRHPMSLVSVVLVIAVVLVGAKLSLRIGADQELATPGFPLLSALLLVPLTGMFAAWSVRRRQTAMTLGLLGSTAELLLAIDLLAGFQRNVPGVQFVEQFQILPWLSYHLGVDGISVLFIPLTALLALLTVLYARLPHERPGAFVASIFGLEAALVGMFATQNLLQFWLFAVLELVPAALLIGRWGTSRARARAARWFVLSTSGGLAILLVGIYLLAQYHADATYGLWSFDMTDLLAIPLPEARQGLVFWLLLGGLATRLPLFPFHAWLPIVAKHGTVAVGMVFLVGVKVGAYALLRFVFPLLPAATQAWGDWVMVLGFASMVYGALLACVQSDLRRMLAFAAVSQSGALIVALGSLNPSGLQGGLLLTLDLGLAMAGLFIVLGLLHHRLGTTRFAGLGGLFDAMPLLGLTALIVTLGSIAMPGTPGFEATHLALEGTLEAYGWSVAIAAGLGNVLCAGYLLWAYQRVFLAGAPRHAVPALSDLRSREVVMAVLLCAVMLVAGLHGEPWIETTQGALELLTQRLANTSATGSASELAFAIPNPLLP